MMYTTFNKKIVAGILIFFTFVTASFSAYPKEVKAFTVVDIVTEVQSALTATASFATQALSYSDHYKEFVLDPLVSMVAKQMLRSMTGSIVNWINSGFSGSPSFLQNPGSFFLDVADQVTGEFLSTHGGSLVNLCSPFSADIKIALSLKFHTNLNAQKRYTCTLGTIIKNAKNAKPGNISVSVNASADTTINNFTNGDFSQGGWPAFAALTTQPQNNVYGAYLTAESDLNYQVSKAQNQKQNEINNGKGFLSWRDPKCLDATQKYNDSIPVSKGSNSTINNGSDGSLTMMRKDPNSCPILTPGTTISAALDLQLGSPTRQLELADEIGEIMNALFAQLATQVLQKGLAASSNKGSNGSSYIDSVTSSANDDPAQVNGVKAEILKNIDKEIDTTGRYRTVVESTYKSVTDVNANYNAAKDCYNAKINGKPPLTTYQTTFAQQRIADIDNQINSHNFAETLTKINAKYQSASDQYSKLLQIKIDTTNAKTTADMNGPSTAFANIMANLYTEVDIQRATEEKSQIENDTQDTLNSAKAALQQCTIFPAGLPINR